MEFTLINNDHLGLQCRRDLSSATTDLAELLEQILLNPWVEISQPVNLQRY